MAGTPPYDKNKIEKCSNPACGRNLLNIGVIFTIKDKPELAYCTRACRSVVTLEEVSGKAAATPAMPFVPKAAKEAAPKKPKPEGGPVAPRTKAAWGKLDGIVKIVAGKSVPGRGQRLDAWNIIVQFDGKPLSTLYEACEKAGINGKATMAKIIEVYGCVEVVEASK